MKKIKLFVRGGEIRIALLGYSKKELNEAFLLLHNHGIATSELEDVGFPTEFSFIRTRKGKLQDGFTSIFFHRMMREMGDMDRNESVVMGLAKLKAKAYIASLPTEPWGQDFEGKKNDYSHSIGVEDGMSCFA